MNWLYYLLEANLYLAAFYVLYKILLKNSTFYNSNRFFLVSSIFAAFSIPLIQFGFLKPQVISATEKAIYDFPVETLALTKIAPAPILTAEDYIIYGYLAFVLLLGLRFIFSIAKIIKIYITHEKRELNGYTLVELNTAHTAFSFFNILFVHPNMAKNNAVLRHEIVHIQQKHSWDIVLLEFLKICCWFNPTVYLIKKELMLLHEYIADERTTSSAISKHEYAMFLIENSMASYSPSLVNQFFNPSILKSRINMLNKEKTANWARLKYLLAVPLGVGLLCVSTLGISKTYGYVDLFPKPLKEASAKSEPRQEKKTYYPKYKHDKDGNYISLEERLIVINGKIIVDKNKYYGTAEADKIILLGSADAIKKYGEAKGAKGAIEIYGEKAVFSFPPPIVQPTAKNVKTPPPPPNPPKVKKDRVKFPPPIVKPDKKDQVKFPLPIVKPDQKVGNTDKAKLIEEIELVEAALNNKEKLQEVEIVPTKHFEGVEIKEVNKPQSEPANKKIESLKIVPTKKVQSIKLTPNVIKNKTGALKRKENAEIKTTQKSLEKVNNVFSKAWTLYQPKAEENKDDRC